MNRRGFLGTLLAGVGLLTVDPKTFLWAPPATPQVLPPLAPEAVVGLNAITRYITEYLSDRWSGRIVEGSLIGQAGLTHQFSVDTDNLLPDTINEVGLDVARYVDPIAASLEARIRDLRAVKFAELPIPPAVSACYRCTNRKTGISVRGVSAYNIMEDRLQVRFDVLCGAA